MSSLSFQHNDLLRALDPSSYARLARFFNHASPLLEKLTGDDRGPLELKLRLPKDRFGKLEPLVVTGLSFRADFIYLYYTDPKHVQLGFEHTGYGGGVSQPIAVDYDAVQTIRIEMGSLYPPETHPFFSDEPPSRILELKRRLKVWVNGVPYLDFNALFYDSSPKDVAVGHDPDFFSAFGKKFTGTIISNRRAVDTARVGVGAHYGAVRLAVQFPAGQTGHHEPLVVTGRAGRGDILYVTYLDPEDREVYDRPLGLQRGQERPHGRELWHIHVLEIDLGSLHPPPAGAMPPSGFPSHYENQNGRRGGHAGPDELPPECGGGNLPHDEPDWRIYGAIRN